MLLQLLLLASELGYQLVFLPYLGLKLEAARVELGYLGFSTIELVPQVSDLHIRPSMILVHAPLHHRLLITLTLVILHLLTFTLQLLMGIDPHHILPHSAHLHEIARLVLLQLTYPALSQLDLLLVALQELT